MTRLTLATGLALVLIVSPRTIVAQSRSTQRSGPSPSTPSRLTSTMTFVPKPPADVRPMPTLPSRMIGDGFVVPLWWRWSPNTVIDVTRPAPPLPANAATGGVQLDILPWSAEVYVDGTLAGHVNDFSGYYHHLELAAGSHVIQIVMPGYEPLALDLVVTPGRTITHRATLTRY